MNLFRFVLLVGFAAVLSGCGSQKVAGSYRDSTNGNVRYQFVGDGSWSAEAIVELPAGVFPHGAGRRLEGKFKQSGDLLELVCLSASRQDPTSGQYRKEDVDLAKYGHRLLAGKGHLVPIGPNGETEALFATDLNPLGARKLVREDKSP